MRARWLLVVGVLLLVGVTLGAGLLPRGALAQSGPADWPVAGGHFFTQASPIPGAGYTVSDENNIPFYATFQQLGGVDGAGYPISQRLIWNGRVIQVFQRSVFVWNPQGRYVEFLNVLDLLHDQGFDAWLATTRSVPPPLGPEFDHGRTWDQIVVLRQNMLAYAPDMQRVYFAAQDPIALYGLPTSPVTDQGNHWAIRLQRAVFQQWKVDTPWARAGQVTVANAGDLTKESGLLGGPAVYQPEAAPALPPAPTPVPAATPLPAPTQPPPAAAEEPEVPDEPAATRDLYVMPSLASLPRGERWAYVSLANQQVTAMVDDTPVYIALATTGKPGFSTPRGNFRIVRRVYNETMDSLTIGLPRDAPEGYYIKDILFTQYFDWQGDALHLNYWQPASVFGRQPTSHGCVGLRYDDAEFFWNFLSLGSQVVIGD